MSEPTDSGFGGVRRTLGDFITAELRMATDLFSSLAGVSVADAIRSVRTRTGGKAGCGTVPAPCWMPQPLGDLVSHASPCHTACVRFRVTNCDAGPRTVRFSAAGQTEVQVVFTPASLTLGPMERGTAMVSIEMPDQTRDGTRFDVVLWVRGCREHFLYWTLSVGTLGLSSTHEVEVDDCPDVVHHWYDHFYCHRQGRGQFPIRGVASHG
jgi:hypothetical protein